jgi:GT2 family glycosyltransferase
MTRSVVAVIVLYATKIADCVSLHSLLHAAAQLPPHAVRLKIHLHDNTEGTTDQSFSVNALCESVGFPPEMVDYVHDAQNSGLATAYNRALNIAHREGYEWLLTLDQDTVLPEDSLAILMETVSLLDDRPDVAAVVPQIRAGGRIVSPNWFFASAWPRWFPSGYMGITQRTTFAFNSGSLLRVSAVHQAGGYSPWFWLDNSDAFIYRRLAKLGKRVFVAGQLELAHDFSMQDMQKKVSPARYRTILLAESAFWDLEMDFMAGLERTLRLAVRVVKHFLRRDSKELRRLTIEALRLRLLHSRRFRIARWRELTAPMIARFGKVEPLNSRPKISVCMAAYNGESFLREQLDSIVAQLSREDEIILIDDRSGDGTLGLLEQFQREQAAKIGSPGVLLIAHTANRGVVRTFEETLRAATGDLLFLADDDDRWAPDKVDQVLKAFAADPDLQIVSTGLELIDGSGRPVAASDFLRYRRFSASVLANLLHNQFQGSTMALRSSALQWVLPFPTDKLFLHDAWIGLRILLRGGKVRHLEESFLLYRRHGANVSRRLSRTDQIKLRLQLVVALLRCAFHKL